MKTTKTKMRKYSLIAGLCAVCLLMAVILGARFQAEKEITETIPAPKDVIIGNLVINPGVIANNINNQDADVTINPAKRTQQKPSGAISAGTEQTIQPDITRPEPSEEQLTDPTRTPDGVVVEIPQPEDLTDESNKPPDTVTPASEVSQEPDNQKPQGGDIRDGEIYIPGFGWVDNHGGGGLATQADDMFESGNKIGIMG
ncbi:MAG: hypothetical protein FWE74_05640 [Oscillospiraceae bacterium]|nr:hypothetical protein [Oscillospiraceae bacterium]